MGVSPESDPYAAYCLDEAVFMWGSYVQSEIDKAQNQAKDNKEAKRKVQLLLRKLLREDEDEYRRNASKDADGVERELPPVKPGRFKDPAAVIRVGD